MSHLTPRTIFATAALPYANDPFHIGHIFEYIQADIWVRYQKACGNHVIPIPNTNVNNDRLASLVKYRFLYFYYSHF